MPPKRKKNAEDEETPRSNRRVRNGSEATRAEAGNQDMDDQEQAEQPRPSKKQASKRPVQDPDQDFDEHDEDGMEVEEEEGGLRIGDIYIPPPPAPALTFEANGPRLIITHITNENFKSYAGKEILGPFHKSFTSIVGPNGSGKSNVIDSMLFVFGYRANKIRSKKISVLLHNSAKFPNVQSCTVSVHFQLIIDKPGDEFEVVPNSRFVISRTAFKDNKSFYEIDGRRVQFKEVAKLLKHHGIDLIHNRFLILQGEVEQIAMMKPKAPTEHDVGMLEYLEDIVGSSRYKEPIEVLQQRVEALNEQRTEKLNRVKLVEKEKDDLQGPRDKAVAYIECENKVTENKHIQQQIYKFDAQKDLENAEEEKKAFEEEMAEITNKLENVADRKLTKTKEYDEIATLRRKAAAKVEKANEEFKQLATEDDRINEMIKIAKDNRSKLKKSLATETKKWEECQGAPEKHRIEIEKLEELKVELEQKRTDEEEAVAKILASLSKETESLQKDKDKLEEQLLELKKTVNETQSVFNIAQSELDIYVSKENHEKATLEKMQETYTGAKQTVEECQKNIAYWEKEGPKKQALLTKTQSDLDNLVKEEGFLDEEIRRVRSQLEEGRSLMAANHSRGRVLDSLMDQKKSGKILGIFGRLGDLGGINEKYDIAISTACGPLDNIVVDTVDTAQQCVLFLRKNNLGLASFIALDKMERWRDNANSKIQTPENVNRLYDLVDIRDERVKTAFYYALRDTLVANDLEQATRIAYGQVRHRVVTLRGDMIEPSGTMSGGGKSVLRGRMGRQVRTDTSGNGFTADELRTMEGRMNSYVEKMQHLREKKTELQRQVATVTQELKESQIEKWTMEIKALKEKASTIEGQLKAQEKQVKDAKPDQNKVKTLEAAIAAKRKNFDEATSAAAKVEEKVQKVRDQIEAIAGRRVKAAQEKLESVVKQLDKTAGDISRLSVAIKTAERNAKKSADKIESLKQELEEIQEEMSANSQRLDEIEKICSPLLEKTEEYKKELAEAEEQAVEIKKELDGIVQDEKKIKAAKIEFDQKVQKITDRVAHSKSRIAHAEREMGKLKFQHIDGEDMREFRVLSVDELETLDRDKLKYAVELGEQDLRAQKPNLAVIEEYRRKEEAYVARVAELDEVTKSRDEQREHVDNLSKARLNEFMAGFGIITMKLKEMYQMITMGGDAELELLDSLDPFTEGIVFSVRPPKKSWKNISNLSGGEKTLSSLALVFALHYYKPTPLYVMDEIDAALDYKNVSIVGHYIKERTKNAQFIVISLRSNMFELADRLVGIYKVLNCTHSVTINPAYYGEGQVNSEEKSKSVSENRETTFDLVRNNTENGQIREPEEQNVTEEE